MQMQGAILVHPASATLALRVLVVCMCTALAHGKGSPPADELERFMQDAGFRQAAIDAALDWGITLADLQGISVGELGDSCKATGRESKRAELKMLNAKYTFRTIVSCSQNCTFRNGRG